MVLFAFLKVKTDYSPIPEKKTHRKPNPTNTHKNPKTDKPTKHTQKRATTKTNKKAKKKALWKI